MIKEKESDIQREILHYLHLKKVFCWKNNNVGIYDAQRGIYRTTGMRGISDIFGVLPDGRFLAVEVKSARGILSEHQEYFLKQINNNNGLAFVARSIDDVIKELAHENYT